MCAATNLVDQHQLLKDINYREITLEKIYPVSEKQWHKATINTTPALKVSLLSGNSCLFGFRKERLILVKKETNKRTEILHFHLFVERLLLCVFVLQFKINLKV